MAKKKGEENRKEWKTESIRGGGDNKVGERHDDVMSRRKRTLCRVAKGGIPYSVGSLIGKG